MNYPLDKEQESQKHPETEGRATEVTTQLFKSSAVLKPVFQFLKRFPPLTQKASVLRVNLAVRARKL